MLRPLFGMFLALAACVVQAQSAWPNRPVRLIIPFPAGTSPDVVMRIATPAVSQMWGQQIVIENRTGASGNIGAQAVATAPADGYTLLYTVNSVICANPHLFSKMPFDPLKAFVPISLVVNLGYVLVARNGLPAATLQELIALAKAQPGKLTYSSAGVGVGTHVVMELFLGMTGTKMLHIPMTTPALNSVYSGETDLTMTPYTTGVPAAKGGKAKGLGVSLARRLDALPDLPAIAEVVPGFVGDAWHGLFAPAGTPPAIVERMNTELNAVLKSKVVLDRFTLLGALAVGGSAADFDRFIRADLQKWARIVKERNLQAD